MITNLLKNKEPGQDGLWMTGDKYIFKKISILYNSYEKTAEWTLINSFYEASITLIPKPNKNYRPLSLMSIGVEIHRKIFANWSKV